MARGFGDGLFGDGYFGSTDYISVADSAYLDVGDVFTLEILARPAAFGDEQFLFNKGTGAYGLAINASGVVELSKVGTGVVASSSGAITAGAYSHIAATKSGSTRKIYVNGEDVTSLGTNQTLTDNSTALQIGGDAFVGRLEEAVVYPTALSADRIRAHYLAKTGASWIWGDSPGAVGYPSGVELELDETEYIDTMRGRATVLQASSDTTEVWRFGDFRGDVPPISIAAGQTWRYVFSTSAPSQAIASPTTADGDYRFASVADGSGTDKTSQATPVLTDLGSGYFELAVTNADAATIYGFVRLRAQLITQNPQRPEVLFEKSVPGKPFSKVADIDVPFSGIDTSTFRDKVYSLLRTLRYPYPRVTLQWNAGNPDSAIDSARKAALLGAEIGDLVRYKDVGITTKSGYLDDWWYIDSIEMNVPPDLGGASFDCRVVLTPSHLWRNVDAITFDSFNRANASGDLGVSTSGDTWAGDTLMNIASSAAVANNGTTQLPYIDLGLGSPSWDICIEINVSNLNADADGQAGFHYRYDGTNYYALFYAQGTGLIVWSNEGGGTLLATYNPDPAAAEIRLIVQGDRHRVWVDGVLRIDITDDYLRQNSRVGIWAANQTSVTFEDFYAEGA